MANEHPAWVAHQRQRWMRHDWQKWIRHDAASYYQPGALEQLPPELRAVLLPNADELPRQETSAGEHEAELEAREAAEIQEQLSHLHHLVADLKFDLALQRIFRKYSPDQPRVPAGNPDGGQWTREDGRDPDDAANANDVTEAQVSPTRRPTMG